MLIQSALRGAGARGLGVLGLERRQREGRHPQGLEVEFESLRALATGGVEFASPPNSPRAKPGTVFFLHDEPKKEWLAWQPKVPLAAEK